MSVKKILIFSLHPVIFRNAKILSAMLAMIFGLIFLASCAVNPATGGANLVFMSEAKEKEVGLEEHGKILDSVEGFNDGQLLDYVSHVGNKIVEVSHRPNLDYQFMIIDSDEINAFALPGGYIYINRGLLPFLNSEAELAAVLAHEVAHITARHAVQRHARTALAKGAAVAGGLVAGVATGSSAAGSQISQVTSIWAQTGLSGFGREQELEADRLAAEYLVAAGYNPTAMIDVITVFKNQEDFKRRTTGRKGSYHGLFATHPRNDRRLQETVAQVGQLDRNEVANGDDAEFRENLDGLALSNGSVRNQDQANRYYQDLLGYTLAFPEGWQVEATTTVTTASKAGAGSLRVEARFLGENIEPRHFIRDNLGIKNLQQSAPLSQYRLTGHTGISKNPESGRDERIAVIYLGSRVFIFRGEYDRLTPSDEGGLDELLLSSIQTFRAITSSESLARGQLKIKYVQASEFFDFSIVAQSSKLTNFPEETLRLLNGYYPAGSPEPGDWIKLVE